MYRCWDLIIKDLELNMVYSLDMEPSDVDSEQILIKHQLDLCCCVITLPINC